MQTIRIEINIKKAQYMIINKQVNIEDTVITVDVIAIERVEKHILETLFVINGTHQLMSKSE